MNQRQHGAVYPEPTLSANQASIGQANQNHSGKAVLPEAKNTPAQENGERRIAHLDMDAFYASVELLRRPDLKGKPVAIGGRGEPHSRGVVTTATYEAREFGIHSGMALRKAVELCPDCIFLPTDFDRYRHYSRMFKAAVAGIAPIIEDRGIDEIYIDLTNVDGVDEERGIVLANRLRRAVQESTDGLTCSIGLAPNKLIAKLASELNKPNGVAIIETADIQTIIWPMPVRQLNGIGPKAEQKLNRLHLDTIGAIASADPQFLIERFGNSYGRWLYRASWGRDDRPVVTHSEPVSRSKETTFDRDLHPKNDWNEIADWMAKLSGQLSKDLVKRGYRGRTIGVKVRLDNFKIITRDLSLQRPTNDEQAIRRAAFEAFSRVPTGYHRIRLIGVKVSALQKAATADNDLTGADLVREPYTPDLFDE